MMRKFSLIIMSAVLCITLFNSCDTKTAYFHYNHTPLDGWEKNDTLVFNVNKLKFSGDYDVTVGMRINGAFPFTKLFLIVEQDIYPRQERIVDTVCCNVTTKQGRPLGQGINYYQYTIPVCEREFVEGDSLHVSVRHCMKRDILPGISDVGLCVRLK